ncbi:reverse transcriptase domain-containing protein [Tanacetum coccineum]
MKKCTKKGYFRRTAEAKEAFAQLKENLATLPTYLFAAHGVVSAMLLTDRDSVQTPVYFISKALQQTELNYSLMEKMILALVCVAKRMRRYFQAHPITVIMDQPIKQVISKPDGQILADFIIKNPEEEGEVTPKAAIHHKPWTLFTDGSSCVDGSGARSRMLTNELS